jgi:hypothetical protein
MSMQPVTQKVRWQDLMVKSEVDVVLELAKKEGWEDCEIFGYGDMITQPLESKGWKLIPADIYKYSIPTEAVIRLHQIINLGVRIKGVIIADDERGTKSPPEPAKPKISLPLIKAIVPSVKAIVSSVMSFAGRAVSSIVSLAGSATSSFLSFVGKAISFIARVLLGLILVASAIGMVVLFIDWIGFLVPIIFLGLCASVGRSGSSVKFDPKLVILVDDGKGGTVWVSLFTWYD